MRKQHRCVNCGKPAVVSNRVGKKFSSRCGYHLELQRELTRKRLGCKRRYKRAHSYKFFQKGKNNK